jgi:hypothetical protein
LDSIDAISQEAARILQRPPLDENGSGIVENGGRSATLTPSFAAEVDHHNLQVRYLVNFYVVCHFALLFAVHL